MSDTPVPFASWLEANPGLVSAATQISLMGPLAGGLRLVALQTRALALVGRVCAVGPEAPVAMIHDWAGGFRLSLRGPAASMAMPPVQAEGVVAAGVAALAANLEKRGYPAPLLHFAPGGLRHSPDFSPLAPAWLGIGPDTFEEVLAAIQAAAATGGHARVAQPALIADFRHGGMPVFDLRVPSQAVEALRARNEPGIAEARPVLVKRGSLGGDDHLVLADGSPLEGGWRTWTVSPDADVAVDVWPGDRYEVTDAPEFMVAPSRISMRLN